MTIDFLIFNSFYLSFIKNELYFKCKKIGRNFRFFENIERGARGPQKFIEAKFYKKKEGILCSKFF